MLSNPDIYGLPVLCASSGCNDPLTWFTCRSTALGGDAPPTCASRASDIPSGGFYELTCADGVTGDVSEGPPVFRQCVAFTIDCDAGSVWRTATRFCDNQPIGNRIRVYTGITSDNADLVRSVFTDNARRVVGCDTNNCNGAAYCTFGPDVPTAGLHCVRNASSELPYAGNDLWCNKGLDDSVEPVRNVDAGFCVSFTMVCNSSSPASLCESVPTDVPVRQYGPVTGTQLYQLISNIQAHNIRDVVVCSTDGCNDDVGGSLGVCAEPWDYFATPSPSPAITPTRDPATSAPPSSTVSSPSATPAPPKTNLACFVNDPAGANNCTAVTVRSPEAGYCAFAAAKTGEVMWGYLSTQEYANMAQNAASASSQYAAFGICNTDFCNAGSLPGRCKAFGQEITTVIAEAGLGEGVTGAADVFQTDRRVVVALESELRDALGAANVQSVRLVGLRDDRVQYRLASASPTPARARRAQTGRLVFTVEMVFGHASQADAAVGRFREVFMTAINRVDGRFSYNLALILDIGYIAPEIAVVSRTVTTPASGSKEEAGLSVGSIVGIAVAGAVLLAAAGAAYFLWSRQATKRAEARKALSAVGNPLTAANPVNV